MELHGMLAGMEGEEPKESDVVMFLDLKRCIGCFSCETSCKLEHDLGMGPRLNRVMQVGPKKVEGRIKALYVPMLCYHCTPAPCVPPCPTNAIEKRAKDGIVWINSDACIGCRQCMQACPYGAIQYDTRTGKCIKCDFCKSRVDYRRTYTREEIQKIYRHVLQAGGSVRQIVVDAYGNIKRDSKGRLVDENGEPLSGRRLAEKGEEVKEIKYEGLWSACATKCSTEAYTFGYYRDLKPLIEEMRKKRTIERIGAVFYGIPMDFPHLAVKK